MVDNNYNQGYDQNYQGQQYDQQQYYQQDQNYNQNYDQQQQYQNNYYQQPQESNPYDQQQNTNNSQAAATPNGAFTQQAADYYQQQNNATPLPDSGAGQQLYVPQNDGVMEIAVHEPQLVKQTIGEFHTYPVFGKDSLGEIECSRRFQNFIDFRAMLVTRYPGLYIPPIPPKKTTGSKDNAVIQERHYFLDLFLKECASLKYLCQSKELQIFLRPQGDLGDFFKKVYAPKATDLLIAYRATLAITEDRADQNVAIFGEEISQFVEDQKILNMHLLNFKKTLGSIVPIKEQERNYYGAFSAFLETYEESRAKQGDGLGALAHVRLITGNNNSNLKDKLAQMTQNHQNPFVHIHHWVKGEVWCLEALNEAIKQRDMMETRKRETQKEIANLQEQINKLNANKFTLGGMFKNESQKKEDAMKKETVKSELEKDVGNFDVIKRFLTIYLATIAIPKYKEQRIMAYVRAMGRMSDCECRNAENTFDCWKNFQKNILSYKIPY